MKSFVPILIALLLMTVLVVVAIFFEQHWREWRKAEPFRRERRLVRQRRKQELAASRKAPARRG
jgi:hypothetical protein